jgi:hypothetical protein
MDPEPKKGSTSKVPTKESNAALHSKHTSQQQQRPPFSKASQPETKVESQEGRHQGKIHGTKET